MSTTITLRPQEQIVYHGIANHINNGMTSVGHMWLTNERLYFRTRPLNFVHESISIPLKDITNLELKNTLLVFNQGLHITIESGESYRFALWRRSTWLRLIIHAQKDIGVVLGLTL